MPAIEGNVQKPSQLYADFHGGLNIRDFWHRIADNELTIANNIRYDDRGAIQPRGGWAKLIGTVSPLTNNIIGLVHGTWVISSAITRYVVVTDGSDVYYWTGAAWTKITGAVVMSPNANTIVSFVSMNNLLIGYDGKNAPWTWDGVAGAISLLAGTPPIGNISIVWQNQLFWAGVASAQTRLYYSAIGDPASYPSSNFIDVSSTFDGDPITGLQVLYGNLLIFKRNAIYILSLNADGTFTLSKNNSSVGCVSPYSVVAVDNLIYFVSDKGLYAMNLYNVKQVCYKVEPRYTLAVANQLSGSNTGNRIMSLHYRMRNEIWVAIDADTTGGQVQHDRVMTHNYDVTDANGDPAVAEHVTGNAVKAPAVMADYYQSSNSIVPIASFYDKFVYVFTDGLGTDAAPASSANVPKQIVTKFFDLGDSNETKTIRHIWMDASVAGGFPIFTFTITNDLTTTFGATLTPNVNIYNQRFDIGQVYSPAQGKYFQFGWLSNDGGTFSFFQFQLDVIFSGRRK